MAKRVVTYKCEPRIDTINTNLPRGVEVTKLNKSWFQVWLAYFFNYERSLQRNVVM